MKETWDRYWSEVAPVDITNVIEGDLNYRLLKRLIDMPQNKNLRILEVGSGSGIRTLALVKEFQNYIIDIAFVDFSSIALGYARENAKKNEVNASYILADALKLPFSDDVFDIVWNGGVNEHFDGENRQLIFNEMVRVCRSRGQVIVIVPNALNFPYRLRKKIAEIRKTWEYGFEKPYTIFELKEKMRNSGLTIVKGGGMGVLGSFLSLRELIISKKKNRKNVINDRKILHRTNSSQIFLKAERILEDVLWFEGRNIGIKGLKCEKK